MHLQPVFELLITLLFPHQEGFCLSPASDRGSVCPPVQPDEPEQERIVQITGPFQGCLEE